MTDTLAIAREFLRDRLDVAPDRVTPEVALADLGVDSLMLLELMFEFEEKIGVTLSQDAAPPKTVGDLLTLVDTLRVAAGKA